MTREVAIKNVNLDMVVEIWSDIVCPFCYIGKKRFEAAIRNMNVSKHITIVYKSFQLDPRYHQPGGESTRGYLKRSKGLSEDQIVGMMRQVEDSARQEGLIIDLSRTIPANTKKAHCVLQQATQKGKSSALLDRLFRAHFSEGVNVEDELQLRRLAEEVGLEGALLEDVFQDDQLAYQVEQDLQQARQIGVQGVPFFVFDSQYAVSGAQPVEVFAEVLEKCMKESGVDQTGVTSDDLPPEGSTCGDHGCEI